MSWGAYGGCIAGRTIRYPRGMRTALHWSEKGGVISDDGIKGNGASDLPPSQCPRRVLAGQMRNFETLTSPQLVCDFLRVKPGTLEHEVFAVIHLDAQNRVIDHVKISHTLPARPMLHISSVQPIGAGTAHWYRLHRSEWCMTASGLSRRHHHHECIRNQLRQHLGFHRPTTAKVYHKRCDSNISRIGPVLG